MAVAVCDGIETPPFEMTLLTSPTPLSKDIGLKDGKLKKGKSHTISRGRAARLKITDGMQGFAKTLDGLTSNQALTMGRIRSDLPDNVRITTVDNLPEHPNAIARSRVFFEFPKNEPGVILIDYDFKAMPQHVADLMETLVIAHLPAAMLTAPEMLRRG